MPQLITSMNICCNIFIFHYCRILHFCKVLIRKIWWQKYFKMLCLLELYIHKPGYIRPALRWRCLVTANLIGLPLCHSTMLYTKHFVKQLCRKFIFHYLCIYIYPLISPNSISHFSSYERHMAQKTTPILNCINRILVGYLLYLL